METGGAGDLAVGIVEDPEASPHWPIFKGFLETARIRGGQVDLIAEHGLLWAALVDGKPVAAVTAYVTTDGAIEVVLGGGDLGALRVIRDRLCQWARDEGASVVRIIGRKGWVRVFGMRIVGRDGECFEMELSL